MRSITSSHTFAGRGSPRGWVLAIARAVYAQHQARLIGCRGVVARLSGRVALHDDELADLVERIDAERQGRELLRRAGRLSENERSALELVDLAGLAPSEAAQISVCRPARSASGCLAPEPVCEGRTMSMTSFEQGLWRHLVDHHGADRTDFHLAPASPRARSRRAVVAMSAGLTIPVAGAIFGGLALTAAPPAYAFTVNGDGTVTVSLNDIATGIPALNQRLAEQGIRITAVPIEAGCTSALMGPIVTHLPMSQTVTVGNRWVPAGYHGFLAARQMPNGQVLLAMGTTAQAIPSCFPTTPTIANQTSGSVEPSGTSGTTGTSG